MKPIEHDHSAENAMSLFGRNIYPCGCKDDSPEALESEQAEIEALLRRKAFRLVRGGKP